MVKRIYTNSFNKVAKIVMKHKSEKLIINDVPVIFFGYFWKVEGVRYENDEDVCIHLGLEY